MKQAMAMVVVAAVLAVGAGSAEADGSMLIAYCWTRYRSPPASAASNAPNGRYESAACGTITKV